MISHTMPGIHFLLFICISALCGWLVRSKKYIPKIRTLPALLAIYESIGRCVEMGRPVLFTVGEISLRSTGSAAALAGFSILDEVTKRSIENGAEIIVSVNAPEHLPIIESILRQSYIFANRIDDFRPENMVFAGGSQFSQIAVLLELMDSRKPGAFIFPGGTGYSRVIYGEHAAKIGAISIAGIINTWQVVYTVGSYDYWLLAEDFLAAGAILSKEPALISQIWSGDIYRWILIALIIFGILTTWIGIDIGGLFSV